MRKYIWWTAALIIILLIMNSLIGIDWIDSKRTVRQPKEIVSVVVQDRGGVAASEGSYESNRWSKWITENGPVDVRYVTVLRSDSKKLLNVMFASGSAPDIINETNAPFRNNLYEKQQILPLDDLLPYMPNYVNLLEEYPQLRKAGTKSDGKLYEIGRINEVNPLHVMFIRQDWLDKLGLSMPETTDQLLEVAHAFTQNDPDNNGKDDTKGINISYHSEGAVNEIFGIQQYDSWGWKDGKIIRQWDKELAALQFKKNLYDLGIVDHDFMSDKDWSRAKQAFIEGKLGIYVNYSMNWLWFTTRDLVRLSENNPSAVIAPLEYPKSPFGQYTGAIDNPIQMTTVFNRRVTHPEAAARYINFMLEPEVSLMLFKGHENEHWVKGENGCPVIKDLKKWQTEVDYASSLFLSRGNNPCLFVEHQFDPLDQVQKAGLDLYLKTRAMYIDPSKDYPGITITDHLPGLPAELDEVRAAVQKNISNLYVRAMISGEAYSAVQAIEEAKAVWEQSGGKEITKYVNDWYSENKENAFMIDDLWAIAEQQRSLLEK